MKILIKTGIQLLCSLTLLMLVMPGFAAEAVSVKVAPLSKVAVYPERQAPATILSLNDTAISTQIAARVIDIPVRVGDQVKKGDVLVKLDCADYVLTRKEHQGNLNSLKERIKLAEKRLKRTQTLAGQKVISEEVLDERESELEVLRANLQGTTAALEMAKLNESRCSVSSPYTTAVVTDRLAAIGQYAAVGTNLIQLLQIDELEISAQVYNKDLEQIKKAEALFFEHESGRYLVKLRRIVTAMNSETRNQEVRLLFVNGAALPGAAGKLVWRDNRIHVPGDYFVKRDGQLGVFTVENNMAKFISVPEAQAGRVSPVLLSETTSLVIEGHNALTDKTAVQIAE